MRALAKQYKDYGRWRHVVARYHEGSINLRYLAPPAAVCAIAAGVVVGAALTPWGFVVPGGYLAAIAAGSLPAGKGLPLRARLRIPVALATMHMSWGWGFLTSPRSLARKVIASRRPAVHAVPAEPAAERPAGSELSPGSATRRAPPVPREGRRVAVARLTRCRRVRPSCRPRCPRRSSASPLSGAGVLVLRGLG